MDSSQQNIPRWRARAYEARWVLLCVFLVLLFFLVKGAITFFATSMAFLLILLVALFLPRRADMFLPINDDRQEIELLRQKVAFRFANTLSDSTFIIDERGGVIHANETALNEINNAAIGNPISFSLRNPTLLSAIDEVQKTGITKVIEIHQKSPSNNWYNVSISMLKLQAKKPSSMVITLHNLSEQKRIEAMRSDFVANASHELRTPLTSLIGFVETMQGPAANDKKSREKFLNIMLAQAGRMSKLIDDLLSLSRIEMRQHVKPTEQVDISKKLKSVVEALQTQAKSAGVEVVLNLPKEKVIIRGDKQELFEMFENLIDNAIKYGAEGKKIEVSLLLNKEGEKFAYSLIIQDYGVGISKQHVPRLTERFYRVDAQNSRKKKGTGLGLAIVKHILNRHGGQLNITSKPNVGTKVEVLLKK